MANSTPKKLPKPNKNEVKKYNDMWNNNEEYLNYKEQETAIKDIWRKYPNNTDFTAILLKVVVLNQLY
ncbi:MAG: hypothetical protein IKI11_10290, partial [Neisseriaceae bacterium]|nr:hypothetical protein [Neisseriaceae bacterium]